MARTALLLAALLLAFACASVRDVADRAGLGAHAETAVYYAGVEHLPVHVAPSASSQVIGRLALHEKVTRTRVARGYAEIRAADRSLGGWVDNAHLLWRVPASGATPAAQPAPAANVAPAGPPAAEPEPAAPITEAADPAPATPALAPVAPAAKAPESPAPAATSDPAPADPPPAPEPKHEPARPRPGAFDPF